jgi:hypothetical protein
MPNTIAEYYTDELIDWSDSIMHYNKEMDELEQKLGEVIRRNSIEGIAEKVEIHQTLLNRLSDQFYKIQIGIQLQEEALKTDSTLIDDTMISGETEKQQNELRSKMQETMSAYIEVKFNCYKFLSDTLRKKKN